jgi:intermediate peptidase
MVEVPSHTLEHFASDARVLSLFARHRTTGEGLPPGLLEQLEASKRRFAAMEQQQQVRGGGGAQRACRALRCPVFSHSATSPRDLRFAGPPVLQLQYCLIDQLLHGPDPPTGPRAEAEVASIMRQHSAVGHSEGCHPHIRFSHLVGYGATYYSYLFAQSLSARIWQASTHDQQ